MENKDIRWIQIFSNFKRAFEQLKNAVELTQKRKLSNLEKQGLIQVFEYTHELSWKVLKDFLESRGNQEIYGSRDAIKEAFKFGLLENGEAWMQMIKSRNLSSHTYDETRADDIVEVIKNSYYNEFNLFLNKMTGLEKNELEKS